MFDGGSIVVKLKMEKGQWSSSVMAVNQSQKAMAAQSKKTGTAFSGMWKQMAAGMGVTTAISAGIRTIKTQVADMVRVGRDFEREWANVTTMLSISSEETEKLRNDLRRLSPTLGDTTDLAKGMYQVLSASIEPAKAIRFLEKAAISAKAGITDTATAVDALTTVVNAYGLEAEAVTDVSDIMFGVVKRGKVTYEQLAGSLGTVVPVAAKLGVGFRDIGAAIATMTRSGIDSRTATMQLRQIMMSVLGASKELQEKARGMGFEFTATALRAKGLGDFLADMEKATGGNNELLKVFIPNIRALSGVMALGGKGARGFGDDLEFLQKVANFTDEAFKKQAESMDFWIETFKVAGDKIKIAAYEGMVAPLRETVSTAEDFDEKVTKKVNMFASAVEGVSRIMSEVWMFTDYRGKIEPIVKIFSNWSKESEAVKVATQNMTPVLEDQAAIYLALTGAISSKSGAQRVENLLMAEAVELYRQLKLEILTMTTGEEYMAWLEAFNPPDLIAGPTKLLGDLRADMSATGNFFKMEWDRTMHGAEESSNRWLNGMIGAFGEIEAGTEESGKNQISMLGMLGSALYSMGTQNKGIAYASAIINTAEAITKALPNIPKAIIVGAMGAVQIATIGGTSIPSADTGAYLPQDMLVQAHKGEIIAPIPMMKETMRETIQEVSGETIVHLTINAQTLDDETIDQAAAKIKNAVDREARR